MSLKESIIRLFTMLLGNGQEMAFNVTREDISETIVWISN